MKRLISYALAIVLIMSVYSASAETLELDGVSADVLLFWREKINERLIELGEYPFIELKSGSKGEEVVRLQERLTELNYYNKSITGTYDSNTVNAVKSFQKASGEKADGVSSIELQKMIFNESTLPRVTPTPKPTNSPKPTKTPKPTATPYIEPKYALGIGDRGDPGTSWGIPYLNPYVKNSSAKITIDGFTLVFYCQDIYKEVINPNIFGDPYEYATFNKKVGPGKSIMPGKTIFYLSEDAAYISVAVAKYHTTSGETIEIPEDDWNFSRWKVN